MTYTQAIEVKALCVKIGIDKLNLTQMKLFTKAEEIIQAQKNKG